ncbi:MAG: ABC transporter substrate-binding protein [Myxococcaceae bacterium]|nr:ABC transporter substrate-binding protein [Myxococcaceae bacterium]MCI0671980.1 ABC transporter substrate-binding protein [Myxococcaceae bacterium]
MNRSIFIAAVGLLLGVGCPPPPPTETLAIGSIITTTGPNSPQGIEQLEAVTLAVEEINAAGGVLGRPLELVNRDDRSDPGRGRAAAEALLALGVPVIIGATASEVTLAVSELTRDAKVVQISGSSTSPLLTTAADDGYLFRTCPSDDLQAELVAHRAAAKSFRRAAVVYVPGAYGLGFADAFTTAFTALGGTITVRKEYALGRSSYLDLLTEVYATSPETILLVGYPVDGAQIIHDYLTNFSARGTFWFFTDGLEATEFVTGVGAHSFTFDHEGTGPGATAGAPYTTFQTAFRRRFGRDIVNPININAYDAVFLAALAMQAAGQAEGTAVRDNLVAVSRDGTPFGPTQYGEAVAALRSGDDIDYQGASGPVDLDANGDVVSPYHLWRVSDGKLEIFEPSIIP